MEENMSRTEAYSQYTAALKQGKRYYNACAARGQSPYPAVLEELLNDTPTTGAVKIGLVDIPADLIVGTWAAGRKTAFAGNFMPLLDVNTEFAAKWISLCEYHLDGGGISDPITCIEYLGKFYVQEGHKRVSVMKSYDAPSIPGIVTRIVPPLSEDKDIQLYYEFLRFFKASRLYLVSFSQPGGYARLQAAMGFEPDQEWTEEDRREFSADYRRFAAIFHQMNGEKLPLTPGDALLSYLQIHLYAHLRQKTEEDIRAALSSLWPDLRLLAQGEPISVSTEPEEKEMGLLTRILGGPPLHVAFVYDNDPRISPWASAHEQGQKYVEKKFSPTVQFSSFLCGDRPDETMEQAVALGANVVFATTPTLIDECRRLAARHKNVAVYNCSLSMPYAGVRSYYCRIYEGKFVTGAIAGAMARDGRIGYVANYPIMGVTAAVNAFALGARLTNPRARISLKWSCLPGNPVQEFLEEGISVISSRDEDGARSCASLGLGTYQVNPGGGLQPLAAPRWNWGKFYQKTIQSLLAGGIDSVRDSHHAINDWWGLNTGVADVDMDENLPDGVKQLARILKQGIMEERIDPFLCAIRDQAGAPVSDGTRRFTLEELMHMDWLCGNIDGAIPGFDELLPQSQNLVRLLGIYRQTIPPKTEESGT